MQYSGGVVLYIALSSVLLSHPAYAQTQPVSQQSIEAKGEFNFSVDPECADFDFEKTAGVVNILAAQELSVNFEKQVREQLTLSELAPSEIEGYAVEIYSRALSKSQVPPQSAKPLEARLRVRIRFSLADLGKTEEQSEALARIYDKLRNIAAALQCRVSLPRLGLFEPVSAERTAIGKAVEAAYPHGEAAADIMRVHIVAVQKVQVEEVTWLNPCQEGEHGFRYGPLTCRARVVVTYLISP
ncbi:MAG TPA: hypothetical protein PKY35_10045 [Candidatus Hydrogenedentes bacterium]|nr:hypothetical protein [Candidatus Hydrogenedentota bacterium]HOL77361.1 hypothetical protein [Candidatus Hydrogenedentota bacterium]HPO84821.1 hypothetical protein [Candidatus Hydrogenedentota bacterium]